MVLAWAGEPGSWADFPAIRAPALIICGENGEPDAAPATAGWRRKHRRTRLLAALESLTSMKHMPAGAFSPVPMTISFLTATFR